MLMYHRVVDVPTNVYDVSPAQLEAHLKSLLDHGYLGGDMSEVDRLAPNGQTQQQFFLTFDDGHRSSLLAAHIAAEYNIKPAFYLTKSLCLERDDFLRSGEIRELSQTGVIGAHGVTHQPLDHLSQAQLEAELSESKIWLEDVVDRVVDTMSFPGGAYNPSVRKKALATGYRLMGNSRVWWNAPEDVETERMINRVAVRCDATEQTVLKLMLMNRSVYLRRRIYYELSRTVQRALSPQMSARFSRRIRRFRTKE